MVCGSDMVWCCSMYAGAMAGWFCVVTRVIRWWGYTTTSLLTQVYAGSDPSTAENLGRYTGTLVPRDIVSTTTEMLVVFRSDATIAATGWSATVSGNCCSSWMCLCDVQAACVHMCVSMVVPQ